MTKDLASIIPLRGSQIFYLDKDHLAKNLNVTLISKNGQKLKLNRLQLAAFNRTLLPQTDDEIVITTNLDITDLSMVTGFITEGLLPLPQEVLQRNLPENIRDIFLCFGIFLDKVLNNEKEEEKIEVKKELLDVKLEELEAVGDFLDDIHEDIEADIPEKPVKRGRKRKVKKEVSEDEEDSDEEEWTPKLIRRSTTRKIRESEDEIVEKAPRKKRKPRIATNLSRQERELKMQCEKFLVEYKDFANLSIPDEENPEAKLFETYNLPYEIEAYKCPPKKIEKINTVQDASHPYPCPSCPAWLNNPYVLKNHQIMYHSEHLQCTLCKYVSPLTQEEDFKLHVFRHDSKKHECIHCGFTCLSLKGLESHFKSEGPFHNNKCIQCNDKFPSHSALLQHVQVNHSGQSGFLCGKCGQVFSDANEIKEHKQKEHKTVKPNKSVTNGTMKMCDLCGKEVASLVSHHKIHHEEDLQKCPECPKICKTKYHLDDHIKGTHSRIPCEHCGLMIPIRRKERHIQQAHVNPEDRKYKCDHCGKGFTDRQKLNDHINTHTGERPYVCKYCGKGFANHGNQRAHIRQAHLGQKRNYRK